MQLFQSSPRASSSRRTLLFTAILLLAFFVDVAPALAGVSGENVIVVVNGDSRDSRTLANHYVHLREIPSSNVIVLDQIPKGTQCTLPEFKTKILQPLLSQIDQRKLSAQVRVIAYSTGFPTAVGIPEHCKRLTSAIIKKIQRPVASLTGMTFFFHHVLADGEGYLGLESNFYCRGTVDRHFVNPFGKGEKRDRFNHAQSDRTDKKFKEAAGRFEKLFNQSPTHAPIALLAAECYAEAGDDSSAARLLKLAIARGWTSAVYLKRSDVLAQVIQREDMASILRDLSQHPTVAQHPIGFSPVAVWTPSGWPGTDLADGVRYLPSCMLGVVHERGSTIEQAISVLTRSATCDRTFPDAPFWFTKTKDVRSTTRFPAVPNALLWLGHLKKDTAVVRSVTPTLSGNCAGLMLGTPKFSIKHSPWKFVPGAITDNLTSHGAAFNTASQTKMTELLHAGAAMTSGPVHEPFAIAQKFPLPLMYGFYASGATAIEAFYLSIASPYQTLIVGDPLAAPYAKPPSDKAGFANQPALNRFLLGWKPSLVADRSSQAAMMELFVEGKLMKQWIPIRQTTVNLQGAPQGKLSVRIALVSGDPLQSRSVFSDWIQVGNPVGIPTVTTITGGRGNNGQAASDRGQQD